MRCYLWSARSEPADVKKVPPSPALGEFAVPKHAFAMTCLLLSLVFHPFATATEARKAPGEVANSRERKVQKFVVFGSGTCSRTFKKVGEFSCLELAAQAASAVKGSPRVWIVTGDIPNPIELRWTNHDKLVSSYSLYVATATQELRLATRVATLKEANDMAEKLRTDSSRVVLVYNLK